MTRGGRGDAVRGVHLGEVFLEGVVLGVEEEVFLQSEGPFGGFLHRHFIRCLYVKEFGV